MAELDIKKWWRNAKRFFGKRIAGNDTDPNAFGQMVAMPNPDPVLRSMGIAEQVYASIMADPHVIGDIRSIRGSLLDKSWRVASGDNKNKQALDARDLCDRWMQVYRPNPATDWEGIMWQMMSAILTGYAPHELVWNVWDGYVVPVEVLDRLNRRFAFDYDARPLLKTKNNRDGEPVEPHQFIISRHMASVSNPYGIALLSSCFWPWTFKTGGWEYFVKYCERHGLPWPVARYPEHASDKDKNDLARAIEAMIDSGYAVVPEGTGVELIVPNAGNNLPQEALINLANREMSKALTGQAMVAELQDVGARAASETAQSRQTSINNADADIPAAGFSQIFRWITLFNFGEDVPAPYLELYDKKTAGKDRAEVYRQAADMGGRPSRRAMMEELNIPIAEDDEDALLPSVTQPGLMYAKGEKSVDVYASESNIVDMAAAAADSILESNVIEPIARMLEQAEKKGKTLAEAKAELAAILGNVDNAALNDVTNKALTLSYTQGYTDVDG